MDRNKIDEFFQHIDRKRASSPVETIVMFDGCGYTKEWQPYKDDYDKMEYDIKLKDGTVVENCYPNAGKFHSISDRFDGKYFHEDDISEIRLSKEPRYGINE